jgi:hypothetical protein
MAAPERPLPRLVPRLRSAVLAGAALAASAILAGSAPPSPTPTPRPKLSGGFGRTPVAGEERGQSMADVVRAAGEAKARREQKTPLAINNKNLVTDPNKGRLSTAAAPPTPTARVAAGAPPTAAASIAGSPSPSPTAAAASQEAVWRDRARAARQRVEEARSRVSQLEAETKKLESDFYSWDDGQYRDGVIKPAWDRKKTELEAARQEQAAAEKDLEDLPEQARKAGALPGWLRE